MLLLVQCNPAFLERRKNSPTDNRVSGTKGNSYANIAAPRAIDASPGTIRKTCSQEAERKSPRMEEVSPLRHAGV